MAPLLLLLVEDHLVATRGCQPFGRGVCVWSALLGYPSFPSQCFAFTAKGNTTMMSIRGFLLRDGRRCSTAAGMTREGLG